MKKKKLTTRKVNAIIASAMAVTLAIPSVAFLGDAKVTEAAETKLPEPVAVYNFERGFKNAGTDMKTGDALQVTPDASDKINQYITDANGNNVILVENDQEVKSSVGNQPRISEDDERGNVLTLLDTVETQEAYTKVPASVSKDGVTKLDKDGNVITTVPGVTVHSSATIENPFAAYKDELTETPTWDDKGRPVWKKGVTISYWVKGAPEVTDASGNAVADPKTGKIKAKDSGILHFEKTDIKDKIHKDDIVRAKIKSDYNAVSNDAAKAKDYELGTSDGEVKIKAQTTSTVMYYTEDGYNDQYGSQNWWTDQMHTSYTGIVIDKYHYNTTDENGNLYINGWKIEGAISGGAVNVSGNSVVTDPKKIDISTNITAAYDTPDYKKIKALDLQGNIILDQKEFNISPVSKDYVGLDLKFIPQTSKDGATAENPSGNNESKLQTQSGLFKYLKEGDRFYTSNNRWYKIVKADSKNGVVTVESAPSDVTAKICKDYGKYANYNKDYKDSYWLKPVEENGETRYLLDKLVTYSRANMNMKDIRYQKEDDVASLYFNFSGAWGFGQSIPRDIYQDNQANGRAKDKNKNDLVTRIQSDNQAYTLPITNADDSKSYNSKSLVNAANDEWTFVTYVIQNDHVSTYYNGTCVDTTLYTDWSDPGKVSAGPAFNKAYGYINKLTSQEAGGAYGSTVCKPNENSEACGQYRFVTNQFAENIYTNGIQIMELLTDESTKLTLGGEALLQSTFSSAVGTAYGTSIDDVAFYIEPMTAAQVKALYAQASESTTKEVKPIAKYAFEEGTVVTGVASNLEDGDVAEPTIVEDASRGSVLALGGGTSEETSAVKLDNPFKGSDATAITMTYWVREEADETGAYRDTSVVSFYDEPKKVDHPNNSSPDELASTVLFTKTSGNAGFIEGYTGEMCGQNGGSGLGNHFWSYTGDQGDLETVATQWHQYAVVVKNSGIIVYRDGELVPNTNTEFPGGRFYDGYYKKLGDLTTNASEDKVTSIAGQTFNGKLDKTIFGSYADFYATPVMSFITGDTTDIYLNFLTKVNKGLDNYAPGSPIYVDDVEFYDQELTAAQIKALFTGEDPNPQPPVTGDAVTYGDVNDDGKIDTKDAIAILKYLSNKANYPLSEKALKAANVDGNFEKDGVTPKVETKDVIWILKYLADKKNVIFPVLQNQDKQ